MFKLLLEPTIYHGKGAFCLFSQDAEPTTSRSGSLRNGPWLPIPNVPEFHYSTWWQMNISKKIGALQLENS